MSFTVKRIKQYIDYKGISIRKFEESIGFSNGSFSSQFRNNKTIGVDKVENILQTYKDINPIWLLTGKGEMLKPQIVEEGQQLHKVVPSYTTANNPNSMPIEEKLNLIIQQNEELRKRNEELEKKVNKITEINSDENNQIYQLIQKIELKQRAFYRYVRLFYEPNSLNRVAKKEKINS